MKLTRCSNGHFYDADKYTECPHCPNGNTDGGGLTQPINMADRPMPDDLQNRTQPLNNVVQNNAVQSATVPSIPSNNELKKEVDDVQKTVGIFNIKKGGTEPVAGWLVCVEGPHFGQDFRIKMGKNFVGRMANMDVVLSKDSSVSREKHLIVVYEPKGNMFIVQSGESKELSYLNDKVILSPQELNPYDVITLGSSKLLFVPLCNENFKWDNYKNDEDEKDKS